MTKDKFSIISDEVIKWCIYLIVFTAPFSKSISEICITLAITLWLVKKLLDRDFALVRTDLNIPFLIFLVTIIPSFFNTPYFALSIKAFFTKILKYVVIYFVIVEALNTKQKLKGLFTVTIISIAMIIMDGLIQYHWLGVDLLHFPGYPSFLTRPVSSVGGSFRGFPTACFPYPNDLSAWILLVLFPLACVTIFDLKNNGIRYLTASLSFGLFYLFFLAKTRGAWLGLAISTVYVALSKNKIWLIFFMIIVIAIPFLLKMEMADYIFGMASVSDRFNMWSTGWEIFSHHPVLGNGINTFFKNFEKYRKDEWRGKKGSYAHNCYLQMACDVGIVGLGAFMWLVFSYFLSVMKNLKRISDTFYGSILWGMSIGICAFLIHSFFDTNLYSLNLATLFWVAIGISQAIVISLNDA